MVSLTIRFLFVVELVRCSLEDSLVSLPVRFLFDFVFDSLVSSTIRFLFVFVLVCCPLEDSSVSLTIRFLFEFVFDEMALVFLTIRVLVDPRTPVAPKGARRHGVTTPWFTLLLVVFVCLCDYIKHILAGGMQVQCLECMSDVHSLCARVCM